MPDLNPYQAPHPSVALPNSISLLHPCIAFIILIATTAVIAIPLTVVHTRIVWTVLYFAFPFYWEIYCRRSPKPDTLVRRGFSTLFRVAFFVAVHVGCYGSLIFLVFRTEHFAGFTPQPTNLLGLAVFAVGLTLVLFDLHRATPKRPGGQII